MNRLFIFIFIFCLNYIQINCHGRLMDPPARSSCWREFGSKCVTEWTDMELFCGGFNVQWDQNDGKCGICGDNYSGTRKWERGGSGYTGYTVRTYSVGQIIDVKVEITSNHLGWFEFRLCNGDALYAQGLDATQDCLNQNVLADLNGKTRFRLNETNADNFQGFFNYKLKLPSSLSCNRCVFQWKYHSGNRWGTDSVSGQQGMGLGKQEEFYGCSDVKIGQGIPVSTVSTILSTVKTTTSIPTKQSSIITSTQRPILTSSNDYNSKCPKGDGIYGDKSSNCRKYFICSHIGNTIFQITEFTCPLDLLYDSKINDCNYPNKVIC